MNYEELINRIQLGEQFEYLVFYGHHQKKPGKIDHSCFSQWYNDHVGFIVDDVHYKTAEHYMMAQKAKLFNDIEAYNAILESPDPKTAKSLGRTVQNFSSERWNEVCFDIVVEGNMNKFTQNSDLMSYIIQTNPKILVEGSPSDRIWGVGLAKNDPNTHNPLKWEGKNLLGFALVEVRNRIISSSTSSR
mmetsp:Transcript_22062/g.22795  ORF Transcript_22062/g.22795 Transcript_22062/m.22795 type:complete len:189 (-) Transcript_22062:42-608(-)